MADSCNSDNLLPYDLNLHIAACFIVMGCSFLGTMIPIVGKKLAGKKNSLPLVCGKLFGSGVILATALIHMFVPADQALTNPCVPKTFAEDYTGFAGVFCLIGILFIHLIQTLVSREMRRIHLNRLQTAELPTIDEKSVQKVEEGKPQPEEHDHHHHDGHHHHHGDHEGHNHGHVHAHGHAHGLILSVKEKHVSTYMLEIGVASHSIIVGLTLGVAREEFKSLLVALTFHQFFEGLALSSVVLDSDFQKKIATIFMVTFYALTTPVGIAIGIGISSSFQESSSVNLLTSGILDAISAGILLYDGLINILGTHFSSEQFSKTSGWKQAAQLFSLWLGAAAMAIVGRWA